MQHLLNLLVQHILLQAVMDGECLFVKMKTAIILYLVIFSPAQVNNIIIVKKNKTLKISHNKVKAVPILVSMIIIK